ncbi:MAG TPA: MarR family transcriptional regulator [Polyangiaceae bacterium]|nr:MarR family transcriptional regulator [Polyangiaceae bacterium]
MSQRRTHLRGASSRPVGDARSAYLAAWRWRREVELALRPLDLTFTQWLVLDATASAISELEDDHAVSQREVAEFCELDPMTVSQVMTTLALRGLVDRGPSATGRSYRIILSASGRRTLQSAASHIKAATERFWAGER